jgi:hypothetical protein
MATTDGSPDQAWMRIEFLAEHDPHVLSVNLSRNYSHQLGSHLGAVIAEPGR